MKPFPEDDNRLTHFLRQHHPPVPPPSEGLEERIMAQIERTPQVVALMELPANPKSPFHRRLAWVVPTAIAATVVAAVASYRTLMPPQPNQAELAELETFIESTWQGTLAEQSVTDTNEFLLLADEAGTN